ncbi:MAG TPA: GTPase-associated system all-helical protein GASH [Candidatus Polarisedimenticolia bacterium]|nr:GTPase-associated system all-helical protein GASH [Candidatus Polarisedimenticolia bacterium]
METEILQKFLDGGLLNLGEDRERFGYVKSAAEDLAKKLLENRHDLITASSVVMGGEISEDEPVMKLSKEAVTNHWQTYGSRFPSTAVQLFRATLLQAIALITQEDSDTSNTAIIYYTTCGLLPHVATTREDEIFREFLTSLAQKVEDRAAATWDLQTYTKAPTIQYKDGVPAPAAVDAKTLKEVLKNAIGPGGGTGANPNWPSSNSNEWLEHYSAGTAHAISVAITSAIKDVPKVVAQSRSDAQAALNMLNEKLISVASETLRADILYWKEALFSPSKKVSYRHLSHDGVIYWAARDLHLKVPQFHPLSVEFFLRETVRSAIGDKEAKTKLTVEQFSNGAVADIESGLLGAPDVHARHRLTPLEAVEAFASKKLDAHDASVRTGIPSQTAIQRDELAVLLFRDFQVRRLAGGK